MKKVLALFSLVTALYLPGHAEAQSTNDANLQSLNKARELFGQNKLDQSYAEYDKVKKDSDFWLESLEEKAQIMGRKQQYDQTISLLQTVTAETFNGVVGPEPYFVLALTHLKTCDYSSVFKVSKIFKERFRQRILDLESINKDESSAVSTLMVKVDSAKKLNQASIGSLAKTLPRNFHRDEKIIKFFQQKSSASQKKLIEKRIKELARYELQEIDSTISKMQILEADAIQRIYVIEHSNKNREQVGGFAKAKDHIQFPVNNPVDGEIWLDELDNYAAVVEKCPTQVKRAGL